MKNEDASVHVQKTHKHCSSDNIPTWPAAGCFECISHVVTELLELCTQGSRFDKA